MDRHNDLGKNSTSLVKKPKPMSLHLSRRHFLSQLSFASFGLIVSPYELDPKKPLLTFGVVTDSHYANREAAGTRYYSESLNKMRECVEVFNREQLDFAIHLGDFKDEDKQKNTDDTLRYLRALEAEYGKFKGPRFHCVGNHDVDSITKQQFLANIENTGIAKEKSYYSFEQHGFHIIVLDANFHPDGRDHFYKEGANWQDTRILDDQLDWLSDTLESVNKPTLVFCHHPLYEFTHGSSIYHVSNYKEVQAILESSEKVVAVFHGHTHTEEYKKVSGIHYATFLAMVDHSGVENNAYAIVKIFPRGKIEITGYRRVADKRLR